MKKQERLLNLLMVGIILLSLLVVIDYLPLHDIQQDYVSPTVISEYCPDDFRWLPTWTAAAMEWKFVTINFVLKLFLAGVNISLILALHRK
jgi:hypothetical protein